MTAITGRWTSPNKGIQGWAIDWLHGQRCSSPRIHLANQLRYIRRAHGVQAAIDFRNYLLWLGCYPTNPAPVL